jgi:hypothetical protein
MLKEYEEYLDKVSSSLKEVIRNEVSSGNDKGETHYLSMGQELFERLYEMDRKWSPLRIGKHISPEEITNIWEIIESPLTAKIQEYLKLYRHRKMSQDIKSAGAKVIIDAAMKEAGLRHHFTGQAHRAKISVLITKNRCITLYIPYGRLTDELPGIIESLKTIKGEMAKLGTEASIDKAQGIWTMLFNMNV